MADNKRNKKNRNRNKDYDDDFKTKRIRKKVCPLCADKNFVLDYTNPEQLKKFVNEKGYIYKPATKEDLIEIINMYITDEYYDLNEINVSLITDFSGLFYNLSSIESKIDAYEEKHGTRETYHSDF